MTSLRLRQYGSADWTQVIIHGDLEAETLSIIGSALSTSGYHSQLLSEDEEWEDLE